MSGVYFSSYLVHGQHACLLMQLHMYNPHIPQATPYYHMHISAVFACGVHQCCGVHLTYIVAFACNNHRTNAA